MTIFLLSLGCPRNLVDSEVLRAALKESGFILVDAADEADIAVVNTCAFIDDAKRESVETVLSLAKLKKKGKLSRLIVTGCLPQRYPALLQKEIGEIDAVFGAADFLYIPADIAEIVSGKKIKKVSKVPRFLYGHLNKRDYLTPPHYVYLKIQEGCPNRCSYCVIPKLRGPLRSRTVESVLEEASIIKKERNVKEFILVAQDITSFGVDRSARSELARLVKELSEKMEDAWIRLLYTHPRHFTEELIDAIASRDNVVKYIDLPIQHISNSILSGMNRSVTKEEIISLVEKLRSRIRGLVLRTSVIVGFPGETEKEFGELEEFLEGTRFERLGAFIYSREEGTPAASFPSQVPETVKKKRFDRIMSRQRAISAENNAKCVGRSFKVLIDEKIPDGDRIFAGRTYMDAPEVDGAVYVSGDGIRVGEFVSARITGTSEYDLVGEKET